MRRCVLCALRAVHDAGWLFRDLKPDNVLIGRDGYARIADFGLAKLMQRGVNGASPLQSPGTPGAATRKGLRSEERVKAAYSARAPIASRVERTEWRTYTLCGTPSYMSPEVLTNVGYGCDVDTWAFGVFVYELLVGTTPFSSDEQSETSTLRVFDNVLKKPLTFPAGEKVFEVPGVRATIGALIGCKKLPPHGAAASGGGAVAPPPLPPSTAEGRWSRTPRVVDVEAIEELPMFSSIDWDALRAKQVPAPWLPPATPLVDSEEEEEEDDDDDDADCGGAGTDGKGTWCEGF